MTAGDVLNIPVRRQLFDLEKDRFPDTTLFVYLNQALVELGFRRPDLLLQTDGTLNTHTAVTALGDTLEFDDEYKGALADYTLYLSFSEDNSQTHNANQAGIHLVAFNKAI